jgi:hypothetical protein
MCETRGRGPGHPCPVAVCDTGPIFCHTTPINRHTEIPEFQSYHSGNGTNVTQPNKCKSVDDGLETVHCESGRSMSVTVRSRGSKSCFRCSHLHNDKWHQMETVCRSQWQKEHWQDYLVPLFFSFSYTCFKSPRPHCWESPSCDLSFPSFPWHSLVGRCTHSLTDIGENEIIFNGVGLFSPVWKTRSDMLQTRMNVIREKLWDDL